MSRRRSRRGHSPVTIQIGIQYAMPRNSLRVMPAKILTQVVKEWVETGETPEGFAIKSIRWIHSEKETEGSDDQTTRTILGRLLQAGASLSFQIRSNEGI
jgi:hypothetical protein